MLPARVALTSRGPVSMNLRDDKGSGKHPFTSHDLRRLLLKDGAKEYRILRRSAQRTLGNVDNADEAVHRVIDEFESRGRFVLSLNAATPDDSLRLYVRRAVRNKCVDIMRERAKHPPIEQVPEKNLRSNRVNDPENAVQTRDVILVIRKVAAALPPRERQLFLFLTKNWDADPDIIWPLYVDEHSLDLTDVTERNNFDVLRKRLRKRLREMGFYDLLKGN